MRKIILASASPRRRELLEQIGVSFEVCPGKGEEIFEGERPEEMVMELSFRKAEEIFVQTGGDALVIGADTVVALDNEILGKPKDRKEAKDMLMSLQGRAHHVYTGVTLMIREGNTERSRKFYEQTEVEFYPVSEEEAEAYVATGEPDDKAGAYGIQGKSAVFVKKIDGDYNNVVGLPVARLYQEAKKMGIDIKEWHEI